MRLDVGASGGGAAAVELVAALQRMSPGQRRFVATRCMVVLLDGDAGGCAVSPMLVSGAESARWVILLRTDSPHFDALFAHEVGHALAGHAHGDEADEREAADFAAALGLTGALADGDRCAATLNLALRRASRFRARVVADVVSMVCQRCGGDASALAAPVPGLAASVVACRCGSCPAEGGVALDAALRCPVCGGIALVTWDGGTDEAPLVRIRCRCGTDTTLRLRTEAVSRPVTPVVGLLLDASRALLRAEEDARKMGSDSTEQARHELAMTLGLAVKRLRSARRLVDGDTRAALIADVRADIDAALALIGDGDLIAAADHMAVAGGALAAFAEALR